MRQFLSLISAVPRVKLSPLEPPKWDHTGQGIPHGERSSSVTNQRAASIESHSQSSRCLSLSLSWAGSEM